MTNKAISVNNNKHRAETRLRFGSLVKTRSTITTPHFTDSLSEKVRAVILSVRELTYPNTAIKNHRAGCKTRIAKLKKINS